MALTDQEKSDVRRFAGYPALGDYQANDVNDPALGVIANWTFETLDHRLRTLSSVEEGTLRTVYLANLATLEAGIVGAADNLDTDQASVWTHNRDEVAHRTALFNQWRRMMCGFLGFEPGPALGDGSNTLLVRG